MLDLKKDLQNEAIKQKETLASEVTSLRGDLQQIRDDRDRQMFQVQVLSTEVVKCKEFAGKSVAELDSFTSKMNELEVCFSCCLSRINKLEALEAFSDSHLFLFCQSTCLSQTEQIRRLQEQLASAEKKLKVVYMECLGQIFYY